jgi:hypothetical protein
MLHDEIGSSLDLTFCARAGRLFRASERGIAWCAADSLAVRSFLGLGLDAAAPDHSTISRTCRLIDVDTHRAVFTWVQERLVDAKLLQGKTVAIDATTLEANAAMRSIVRLSARPRVRAQGGAHPRPLRAAVAGATARRQRVRPQYRREDEHSSPRAYPPVHATRARTVDAGRT